MSEHRSIQRSRQDVAERLRALAADCEQAASRVLRGEYDHAAALVAVTLPREQSDLELAVDALNELDAWCDASAETVAATGAVGR